MDLNWKVEVWGSNEFHPEKIVSVGFEGAEFRVCLYCGEKKVGHFVVFRGNDAKGDQAKVVVDFVPGGEANTESVGKNNEIRRVSVG